MSDILGKPLIYVVDDDADLGGSIARLLQRNGYAAEPFINPEQLLLSYGEAPAACVVTDIMMGDMDGFDFATKLHAIDPCAAIVFMTAWPSTERAVDAIKQYGGLDYLEKPIDESRLMAALEQGAKWSAEQRRKFDALSVLSKREREVFELLVKGLSTKEVARELGVSPRTIEDHRANIGAKTRTSSLRELIALAGTQK
jgi:FixJ family two-component response regulator